MCVKGGFRYTEVSVKGGLPVYMTTSHGMFIHNDIQYLHGKLSMLKWLRSARALYRRSPSLLAIDPDPDCLCRSSQTGDCRHDSESLLLFG